MKKFRTWLVNSYNGIYPILRPSIPSRGAFFALVIGVLVGLFWAYRLAPTVYYDADPSTLERGWQDEWVSLLADRYALATATGVPSLEFEAQIVSSLGFVENPTEIVDRLGIQDGGFRALAQQAEPGRPAPKPNTLGNLLPFIIAPLVLIVVYFIVSILWGLLIRDLLVEPIIKRLRGGPAVSDEATQRTIDAIRMAKQAEKLAQGTAADSTLGEPVIRKMSVYLAGRGQYDESFSIEDASDMFLGECGATIAETIGAGEPAKVAAVEVWLFDKEDYVRTVTKVLVSEYAYNDPALRSKLETKGELVLVQPGAVAILETNTLRMQARVVDMAYGTGPLPANSYFDRFTLELAVWQRQGAPAAAAVPAPAFSAPASYTPPAATPQPSAPAPAAPAPFGARPYTPPTPYTPPAAPPPAPAAPPRRDDDDPFGGTGDFTPIGGS
ncbi:MAG: hypothetical protein BroJett033_7690 [Chloroflexota bacterium]|nr:MAG: hypothetical protein BroJett033_7690 [Chloroflexota bacterium]